MINVQIKPDIVIILISIIEILLLYVHMVSLRGHQYGQHQGSPTIGWM